VSNIYARLDEELTEGEYVAFQNNRFEETLGALSRRLADPRRVLRAVGEELEARDDADLSAHDTLLGLSRNLEGKPVRSLQISTRYSKEGCRRWRGESPRHPLAMPVLKSLRREACGLRV
jgi:hypothetical protein